MDDVRVLAGTLERAYEVVVHGRFKWRVGSLVFVSFSKDEALMGFGFPKEDREALVLSDPVTFMLPSQSDMRYQWVVARLDRLDHEEMTEFVVDAWRMVVPQKLSRAYDERHSGSG